MYWKIYTYNSISEVSPVDSPFNFKWGKPLLSTLWGTSVYRRQMKTVPKLRTCTVHHGWFPRSMKWSDLNVEMSKTLGTYSSFSHESKLICTDPVYSKCNIPSRKLMENKCFPLNKCHQIYGFPIGFNLTRSPTLMSSDAIPCNTSPIVLPRQSGPVVFFVGISYPTMVLTLQMLEYAKERRHPSFGSGLCNPTIQQGRYLQKNAVPSANQNLVETWNLWNNCWTFCWQGSECCSSIST